jgi:hypothetical protein
MDAKNDSPQLIQSLTNEDIAHSIVTQLATANYLVSPEMRPSKPDMTYDDNEKLWADILDRQLNANVTLTLENFHLSDWFPRSPGLYYTPEAKIARDEAKYFLVSSPRSLGLENIDDAERLYQSTGTGQTVPDFVRIYDPYGKASMLRGGVGSIRLRDKRIAAGNVWFMSASSTPTAHEGFPIAVPDYEYHKYYNFIRDRGFIPCTLVGKLQWVPQDLQEVYNDYVGVKQLYLLVDEIHPRPFTDAMELLPFRVSVAVTFESEHKGFPDTYASYVTFYPAVKDSLEKRKNWLENIYVKGMYQGKIVTDFDETERQFKNARFSLEKVMNHRINPDQVEEYLSEFQKYHPYQARDVHLTERLAATLDQISRRLQTETRETESQPSIKILFLAANPRDTTQLRLGEEMRAIDQALRQAEFRDRFDIKQHWAVRVTDIQGLLLRHQPDIVHFSGHGSATSEIFLEDNTGRSHSVTNQALNQMFSLLKDNIKCVVLNACYSEPQARAISQHIDCVVGMSTAIGDEAAINFAAAFYQGLGYGRDVKTAFDLGCNQIDLEGLDEQDTPKLLSLTKDPKKIIFVQRNI